MKSLPSTPKFNARRTRAATDNSVIMQWFLTYFQEKNACLCMVNQEIGKGIILKDWLQKS